MDTFAEEDERPPEIHLVAHSEGTVISLLALLQGLSDMELEDTEGLESPQGGH